MPCVAIDLFCGIGGLTKGLSLSGIEVCAGIDIDDTCRFAYEHNNDAEFINQDVTILEAEQLENLYPNNCIRALVGCAPCQPFSRYTNRYRKKGPVDDKWRLLYSFARLTEEIIPDIISMENVPELANETVFKDFVTTLKRLGYFVDWKIVYCPEYGVPQNYNGLIN